MGFTECIEQKGSILMEGALGERLKREYSLPFDDNIVMGSLVYSRCGRNALEALWSEYAEIAYTHGLPFLATTTTRRTNQERVERSGYDKSIIQRNVDFLRQVQTKQRAEMYVGGLVGCKGDAYTGEGALNFKSSRFFHAWEIELFAQAKVDFIYAALIPSLDEAAGIAAANAEYKVPYIISFTIQKNGRLIDGQPISQAIEYIDRLIDFKPVCYMTNCVHPRIVYEALSQPINNTPAVKERFMGIQANTSALSYEELDHAIDLKTSDPVSLAEDMLKLRTLQPFKIFGGCCGTDGSHMDEIAKRLEKQK